jgi:hypothetical protein
LGEITESRLLDGLRCYQFSAAAEAVEKLRFGEAQFSPEGFVSTKCEESAGYMLESDDVEGSQNCSFYQLSDFLRVEACSYTVQYGELSPTADRPF